MEFDPQVKGENGYMDVLSMNIQHRNVLINGEVTDTMSATIVSQLLYLDSVDREEPINLYINSPGGSVSAGLAIYDTMQHISAPVSTLCLGRAASMGAILLSGGTKGMRKILPHAEVMVHQPSGGIDGQAKDITIAAAHIEKLRRILNQILAENCGKTPEEVEEATERDHWMQPEEAITFGIVDEIIN